MYNPFGLPRALTSTLTQHSLDGRDTGIPSTGIRWWMLEISWCPSRRVGELSPAQLNKLQIPAQTSRGHCSRGTTSPSDNDATVQPCAASEQRRKGSSKP